MIPLAIEDLKWCLRRTPKAILTELQKRPGKAFIAGGFIRSCIAREPINDVDIFVPSQTAGLELAEALVKSRFSPEEEAKGVSWTAEALKKRIHTSENAFTVRGFYVAPQIVHRWTFEKPEDCIASFDFTIACAAFWWGGDKWQSLCDDRFYPDLASKRLCYRSPVRNEDAGGSMLRVLKFYQRGYRIPMDSLGAVIARMCQGVRKEYGVPLEQTFQDEKSLTKILTGLLRAVDPDIDPHHVAHLPSESETEPSTDKL